jgi:Fe2+ transport system protein B
MNSRYIKCLQCGTINKNTDYCTQCKAYINLQKQRKKETQKAFEKRQAQYEASQKSGFSRWLEKQKTHKFLMIRIIAWLFYSFWLVVMLIGSFLAWLAATIAA